MAKNNRLDLPKIAEDAIRYGFIALDHLPYIMARERDYNPILPELYKSYQLDLRGPKRPKIKTVRDRTVVWRDLCYRWAFGTAAGVKGGQLKAFPLLPLYSYDGRTGALGRYNLESMDGVAYVKLDDLAEYLPATIGIPLPPTLFPYHENRISGGGPSGEKITPREGISGEEIMNQYQVRDIDLFHCMKQERLEEWDRDDYKAMLQPYCRVHLQRIEIKRFDRPEPDSIRILVGPPFNPDISTEAEYPKDLFPYIPLLIFKRSEVEPTLKKYGLWREKESAPDLSEEKETQKPSTKKKYEYHKDPEFKDFFWIGGKEVEFLYDNILSFKKSRGFDQRVSEENLELEDPEGVLRDETVQAYAQQNEKFKWIKEDHLKDRAIYKMSWNKEKRDFIGKLLQKMAKDYYPSHVNLWGDYQKLYKLFLEIKKVIA